MFEGNYPQLMAEYNRWMNERLYEACAGLSDEERTCDLGAFFKSIHGTLEHLVWGDRIWLARFNGKTYPASTVGEPMYDDFEELRSARRYMDNEILEWAKTTTPEYLAEPMTWSSKLYKFTQTHPRWVQIVQMFNHQTHHRGQVTTLLKQLGVDPGVTDVPLTPVLNT
jgi:uncharacterized damage-inducible protein DinB